MAQRAIIGLLPGTDWTSIGDALRHGGAESIEPPRRELPDVVIVTLPDTADMDAFLRSIARLAGVRYAEPDAMRFTT